LIKSSATAYTHIGNVRSNNEDNYSLNGKYKSNTDVKEDLCFGNIAKETQVYSVCDGMGGQEFGEKASLIAVKTLVEFAGKKFDKAVTKYIEKTNKLICTEIDKNSGVRIGTTLSLLYINEQNKAIAYNIGDSRVYMLRSGELSQLSIDHTQAQRLIELGLLQKENANNHKSKHKLTQHLGIFPDELIIEPHISEEVELRQGDIFLLCSDGLTDMLTDDEIEEVLSKPEDTTDLARLLVNNSLDRGGKDNVTVVVIKIDKIEAKSFWNKLF